MKARATRWLVVNSTDGHARDVVGPAEGFVALVRSGLLLTLTVPVRGEGAWL